MLSATKRLIAFVLILAVCLSFSTAMATTDTDKEAEYQRQYALALEISQKQAPAREAGRKIYAAVGEGPDFSKTHLDSYGGMYLDFEGNLYVVITEYTQAVMDQYREMADGFENIVFVQGKYNYNELYKMKEEILAFSKKTPTNIFSVGVSNSGNAINITTLSDKAIGNKDVVRIEEAFAGYPIKITDTSDEIDVSINTYDNGESKIESAASGSSYPLYGGEYLYTTSSGPFSLGWCGTYNGNPAIITAGHCALNPNEYVWYQGFGIIGKPAVNMFSQGYDYAIVPIDPSASSYTYTLTNQVKDGTYLTSIGTPMESDTVFGYGNTSMYYFGVVEDPDTSYFYGGLNTMNGVTSVYYTFQGFGFPPSPGDSGSTVYNQLDGVLHGILSGKIDAYSRWYFTNYSEVSGFSWKLTP